MRNPHKDHLMRIVQSLGLGAIAVVALAACGGSNKAAPTTASPTTSVSNAPTVTAGVVTTAPKAQATTANATTTKINANKATRAELQAAFEAAGISNAAQWAREVEEYRPYTADDANWGRLRKELAKYNIASDVLEKIIATLAV